MPGEIICNTTSANELSNYATQLLSQTCQISQNKHKITTISLNYTSLLEYDIRLPMKRAARLAMFAVQPGVTKSVTVKRWINVDGADGLHFSYRLWSGVCTCCSLRHTIAVCRRTCCHCLRSCFSPTGYSCTYLVT